MAVGKDILKVQKAGLASERRKKALSSEAAGGTETTDVEGMSAGWPAELII